MTDSLAQSTPLSHELSSAPHVGHAPRTGSRDAIVIFLVIAALLALVAAAVWIWGVVALAMAALALVPVILMLLVVITFG